MNRSATRRRQDGFTLVELLVVCGIIAVLTAILLPALSRARGSARTLAGLSNQRQIGLAIMMYARQNNDLVPPGYYNRGGDSTTWALAIVPYLGGKGYSNNTVVRPLPAVLKDPNAGVEGGEVHYASNPLVIPDMMRKSKYDLSLYIRPFKMSNIRPASSVAIIWDTAQRAADNWSSQPVAWQINSGIIFFDSAYWSREGYFKAGKKEGPIGYNDSFNYDSPGGGFPPGAYIRFRQSKSMGANVLFADGHAETVRKGGFMQTWLLPQTHKYFTKTAPP